LLLSIVRLADKLGRASRISSRNWEGEAGSEPARQRWRNHTTPEDRSKAARVEAAHSNLQSPIQIAGREATQRLWIEADGDRDLLRPARILHRDIERQMSKTEQHLKRVRLPCPRRGQARTSVGDLAPVQSKQWTDKPQHIFV
jgi:hypothetical protein